MNRLNIQLLALLIPMLCFGQNQIISEEVLIKNDSIVLPGTLTYNDIKNKQPLAIFVHGSGDVDRNGNSKRFGVHSNTIQQLSDSLVSKGIAFYRYDKRSATMSNLLLFNNMKTIQRELVFEKLVEDTKLVVDKFKEDTRFSEIILIGHSQGSLISMLVKEGVDKFISLAGASNSFDTLIVKQYRLQLGDSIANALDSHFKELKTTGSIKKLHSDPRVSAYFSPANLPFVKSWLAYIPTEEIMKVKVPTVIINGNRDNQVFEEDAKALHKAKPDATLIIIENMNHALKTITNDEDNIKSLQTPDFPLSEELVTKIAEFIKK